MPQVRLRSASLWVALASALAAEPSGAGCVVRPQATRFFYPRTHAPVTRVGNDGSPVLLYFVVPARDAMVASEGSAPM